MKEKALHILELLLLFLFICTPLYSVSLRDISSITYESRSNSINVWNAENTLITWILPENPLIIKTGAKIYDHVLLFDVELGTAFIWPDKSYSQLSYSMEIVEMSQSLFFDFTREWESGLLTTGLKGSYSSRNMGGLFFLGYKYIQDSYSLWGRSSFSFNTVQSWNGSFWGEGEMTINDGMSVLLGFTSGGYKRDDESIFRGVEFSGLTGFKLRFGKGSLRYGYKLLSNYDYWSQSHSIVFDYRI